MPNDILINEEQKLVCISSYGNVTPEDMGNTIKKLKSIMDEQEICCVLVDTTKQEEMPGMGSLVFLTEDFPDEMKIAVLIDASQATTEELIFLEEACAKKGKQLKCFYTIEEAEKWLM